MGIAITPDETINKYLNEQRLLTPAIGAIESAGPRSGKGGD